MASIQARGDGWRVQIRIGAKRASKCFTSRDEAERWAARKERGLALQDSAIPRELLSLLPRRTLGALRRVDFHADDVLHGAIPAVASCGIYFLIRSGDIVYVGKTTDVFLRLSKHRRDGKVFDSYNFMPCDESDLDELERLYIEAFLPKGNFRL